MYKQYEHEREGAASDMVFFLIRSKTNPLDLASTTPLAKLFPKILKEEEE